MATTRVTGPKRMFSARRFIGKDVYDVRGAHAGECEDLIVDVDTGCVAWAIVTAGQFLGMDGHDHVVPIQTFSIEPGTGRLLLSFSQDRFRSAPAYRRDVPPPWHDPQWAASVYVYYGMDASGHWPSREPAPQRQAGAARSAQPQGYVQPEAPEGFPRQPDQTRAGMPSVQQPAPLGRSR